MSTTGLPGGPQHAASSDRLDVASGLIVGPMKIAICTSASKFRTKNAPSGGTLYERAVENGISAD